MGRLYKHCCHSIKKYSIYLIIVRWLFLKTISILLLMEVQIPNIFLSNIVQKNQYSVLKTSYKNTLFNRVYQVFNFFFLSFYKELDDFPIPCIVKTIKVFE